MIIYITGAIATGLLVKADDTVSDLELSPPTYVIVSVLWFITLPFLILSVSSRILIHLINISDEEI